MEAGSEINHRTTGNFIEMLVHRTRVATPNDPKLSDRGVRRGTCTVGGKAAVEAGDVTHGAVRCSAWLGAWLLWFWFTFFESSRHSVGQRE